MSKTIKIVLVILVIAALLYWFYAMGGPQPVETIEQPVNDAAAESADG